MESCCTAFTFANSFQWRIHVEFSNSYVWCMKHCVYETLRRGAAYSYRNSYVILAKL